MKADLYQQNGEKIDSLDLNPSIFEVPINQTLIRRGLLYQLANKRTAHSHTKTKGEVRGGGRKPYKQKGTGRARQGSIRNPHFIGGGVAFGPRNTRNYKIDMPKKERRKALFSTLSSKAKKQEILILDSYTAQKNTEGKDIIKTKTVVEIVKKFAIDRKGLFILPEKNVVFQKASRNIPNIKSILVNYLNIYDLLNYNKIIFFKDSLKRLEELFLNK